MRTTPIVSLVAAAMLGFASGASAEVYRWVDASGRTHYADRAPPRTAVERIDPAQLSTYQSPRLRAAIANNVANVGVDAGARPPSAETRSDADERRQLAAWREQCLLERWADCDDARVLAHRYGWAHVPLVVRPRPGGVGTSAIALPPSGSAFPPVDARRQPLR
jgi:hypothetical protein